jgi:glucose-1-phosphate cytidylyltransferase
MKVIILAGGLGTRISEETMDKPKPMVAINGKPLLWHLMNIFAIQGFNDFVIALGYRGEVISDWVKNLKENWKISCLETGEETQTGGRLAKCITAIGEDQVIATYGDGLANVSVHKLLKLHAQSGTKATLTAVRPPARFGYLELNGDRVLHFGEKNQSDAGWINGGFFVLENSVVDLINGDFEPFETGALPKLAQMNQLSANLHEGFWQPMDTLREKEDLERLSKLPLPPWLTGLV